MTGLGSAPTKLNKFSLADVIEGAAASVEFEGAQEFTGIATDTRKHCKGTLFLALKGDNFDAHNFIPQILNSGVSGAILHRPLTDEEKKIWESIEERHRPSIFLVADTLKTLQRFGSYWRKKWNFRIVGIAGSNGKTTTKNWSQILVSQKFSCQCTQGNLNNHIGVPLTLLSFLPTTKVGVVELGMNHAGELAFLTEMAQPNVVLITSLGHEHIEFFGSLEKIAEAEEEIFKFAPQEAARIFSLDEALIKDMASRAPKGARRILVSSYDKNADVFLREVVSRIDSIEVTGVIGGEPGTARVPVFGRHNISNMMSACAAAFAVGVDPDHIWQGLPKCQGEWGRNQIVELTNGARCIFDAYNANPESAKALLDNFSRLNITGKKIGVFADMLELGELAPKFHMELGEQVAARDFDHIWYYGNYAKSFEEGLRKGRHKGHLDISESFDSKMAEELEKETSRGDIFVIKGSRGMRLERVVLALNPRNFEDH